MIICGLPNVICAIAMLLFIPESPKFTFSQADEVRTLSILQTMYKINTGKSKDSYPVKNIINDNDFDENSDAKCKGFLPFVWSQTVPLFQRPHLKNTLTACFIQFCIFNCSNGFWTFFPEIVNKITVWTKQNEPNASATLCEILEEFKRPINETQSMIPDCDVKLEFSAFSNAFMMLCMYILGWIIISFIINRTGKLIIIMFTLFSCASCAFALIFVSNPTVSSYMYSVILAVGIAITVLNASTIELYPTKLRAMAVCISLMMGRLGSVVGSNVIGFVLDEYCNYTFLMPTILLITSGILACTIPNISKRQK